MVKDKINRILSNSKLRNFIIKRTTSTTAKNKLAIMLIDFEFKDYKSKLFGLLYLSRAVNLQTLRSAIDFVKTDS